MKQNKCFQCEALALTMSPQKVRIRLDLVRRALLSTTFLMTSQLRKSRIADRRHFHMFDRLKKKYPLVKIHHIH